jgi:hypothetical protein
MLTIAQNNGFPTQVMHNPKWRTTDRTKRGQKMNNVYI